SVRVCTGVWCRRFATRSCRVWDLTITRDENEHVSHVSIHDPIVHEIAEAGVANETSVRGENDGCTIDCQRPREVFSADDMVGQLVTISIRTHQDDDHWIHRVHLNGKVLGDRWRIRYG